MYSAHMFLGSFYRAQCINKHACRIKITWKTKFWRKVNYLKTYFRWELNMYKKRIHQTWHGLDHYGTKNVQSCPKPCRTKIITKQLKQNLCPSFANKGNWLPRFAQTRAIIKTPNTSQHQTIYLRVYTVYPRRHKKCTFFLPPCTPNNTPDFFEKWSIFAHDVALAATFCPKLCQQKTSSKHGK